MTVPTDFLGMTYIQYPVTGANPDGIIDWGSLRLCQQVESRWSTIETSAGVYSASALANLDSIITFQRQNGASVYFGVYGTPTFYAQTAANPTYGDDVTKGPWGALGECSYPTSLAAVTNFVNLIMNRYNKAGGTWYDANFATLGKGIQYWETWNEPPIGSGGNGNSTGSGYQSTLFWWGTKEQMVDMAQTQYAAIKAIDSSVIVTTPGFSPGLPTCIGTFLSTTGIVTAKTGLESSDAVAWHPYEHNPAGVIYGTWTQDIVHGTRGVKTIKDYLTANGYSLPLYISEFGVDAAGTGTTVTNWYAAPAQFRYEWYCRLWMVMAAFGVQQCHEWNWAETNPAQGNSGWWQGDLDGVVRAKNDFATKVSGKTITSGTFGRPGPVTLNFSDGTSWTV